MGKPKKYINTRIRVKIAHYYLLIKNMSLPRKVLLAVTSYNEPFYPDGKKTGLFYTEALHPYLTFVKAGFEVDIATETGTYGVDEHSVTDQFLSEDDKKIYNDDSHPFSILLNKKLHKASDLDPKQYGIFFGSAGHATLYDYPHAKGLIAIAEDIYSRGGIVSAVCHGPAILPFVKDTKTGKSVIEGRTITGFTTEGEVQMSILDKLKQDKVLTVEEHAANVGAHYVAPSSPFADCSKTDGRVVTGANPASAYSTAAAAVAAFEKA
ncbi:class I glutamine amidotransferase-like protein [Gilbertella persicaria]|uniref:class I glutamine amidotransferase-like protein n=1 Tax=Gilbertella persicaria TaxID=101096 RepID=UPI00221FDA59|nr:class I glutamine amidotransferase-like protein [Gilbertella persicaria]KAI8075492.1 class I glutamine amidotransferase-like protein [Gilbertella persicaria]